MGAKYLPTVKDQKATLRFQRLQAEKLQQAKAAKTAAKAGKPVQKYPDSKPSAAN